MWNIWTFHLDITFGYLPRTFSNKRKRKQSHSWRHRITHNSLQMECLTVTITNFVWNYVQTFTNRPLLSGQMIMWQDGSLQSLIKWLRGSLLSIITFIFILNTIHAVYDHLKHVRQLLKVRLQKFRSCWYLDVTVRDILFNMNVVLRLQNLHNKSSLRFRPISHFQSRLGLLNYPIWKSVIEASVNMRLRRVRRNFSNTNHPLEKFEK